LSINPRKPATLLAITARGYLRSSTIAAPFEGGLGKLFGSGQDRCHRQPRQGARSAALSQEKPPGGPFSENVTNGNNLTESRRGSKASIGGLPRCREWRSEGLGVVGRPRPGLLLLRNPAARRAQGRAAAAADGEG
jgi:hypothetical protein